MGLRKKIYIGFISLAFLLFFSGLISFFELNRLSRMTRTMIDGSAANIELAKGMLDAVQDQNTALLEMIVTGSKNYDSVYDAGKVSFVKAFSNSSITVRDLREMEPIYLAREAYENVVNTFLASGPHKQKGVEWFMDTYRTSYNELTSAIKNYMLLSQNKLNVRAELLENNAYRAITPGIITLAVAIMIIFMFLFLIDIYFAQPVVKISKALQNYIHFHVPFDVKIEGKDEVLKMKEGVESLINMNKTGNR